MYPSAARPALGSFVRDQVTALRRIPEVELELFSFPPGGASAYALGAAELRQLFPDAVILRERFLGLTKSLIAAGPAELVDASR